jgi:putative CocE/NonD family hydrolase
MEVLVSLPIANTQSLRERWEASVTAPDPTPVVEVGIPMRDGVELAADVYLPVEAARPAPAIVTITPYDKSSGLLITAEARYYQENGYAFVAVDCRGRGKSEGEWRAIVNDHEDGHDVVEWVAAQPWCTGKVGMTGLSYMGWTQWAAASQFPPHLTCMVSTSAAGRWQQEIPYTDGCFQLYFGWWVYLVRRRISELYGLGQNDWNAILRTLPIEAIGDFINPTGPTWRDVMDRDTLDDFWRAARVDDAYQGIDVPCLHVTGWFDLEDLLGAFAHYEGMMANSPARDRQQLIVGPWSHGNSRNPHHSYAGDLIAREAAVDMDAVHLRWFDHWLKGIDNGAESDPAVRIFETGSNVWREDLPWSADRPTGSLYLRHGGGEGALAAGAGDAEPSRAYRYDPEDPSPTQIDVELYPVQDVPLDQTAVEARADVLTWTSAPLTEEVVVSGWPHLELFASSDCDDTEWHVKLTDVGPDGRSMKVCQGCLRASYRDSLEHPSPLTPGEIHRFLVELWPVHHAFLPGHRIRVSVTSSDFPWFARSLNQFGSLKDQAIPKVATNTIHHGGDHASRIILPIQRGALPA